MDLLERFGTPLVSYEGSCESQFEYSATKLDIPGYFEASQYRSGRIVIGVVGTNIPQVTNIPPLAKGDEKLSFHGRSTEGWQVLPLERIVFPVLGWQLKTMGPPPYELNLTPRYFEASSGRASQSGYHIAHFLISNFLWHDFGAENRKPQPIELTVRGFRIEITPVEDYVTVAQQLINGRGTHPTAWVNIDSAGGPKLSLKRFSSVIEELMFVFRIVTGNQVNWYYGEALRTSNREPVERLHQYTGISPYSNTFRFRHLRKGMVSVVPKVSLSDLTLAFFDEKGHSIDKETLNIFVNQFTNATSSTPFLESAGLIASTLMDLIVSKYAAAKDKSEMCPEATYVAKYLPALKQAVKSASVPQNIAEQAALHLRGSFRYTFRQKLKLLRDDLRLPLSDREIGRIVKTRNLLVHEGTFGSNPRGDYDFLIWTILMSLCRLCGYIGDLPIYRNDIPLEV